MQIPAVIPHGKHIMAELPQMALIFTVVLLYLRKPVEPAVSSVQYGAARANSIDILQQSCPRWHSYSPWCC